MPQIDQRLFPFTLLLDPKSEEGVQLKEQQQALFDAHLSLINYALHHGYSYARWKSIVNVMIEKDPGNTKVHRLRVIHLYEFDLGACMAIQWKDMLAASELRGTINDGQFGGRKEREATNLALAEELKIDICHASRKSLGLSMIETMNTIDKLDCFIKKDHIYSLFGI
jgi:hypothetical protein